LYILSSVITPYILILSVIKPLIMGNSKYLSNRKSLKDFRKTLRNRSTSAESTLWKMLKNSQLEGRKFRRQHSIGNYIVDFYCSSDKLIIELDGNQHGDYIQIPKDEQRDSYLEASGYKILRFENRFVFQDIEFVLETIRKSLISKTNTPSGKLF
jgi:very-short-patch-repair endonuclease